MHVLPPNTDNTAHCGMTADSLVTKMLTERCGSHWCPASKEKIIHLPSPGKDENTAFETDSIACIGFLQLLSSRKALNW